MLPLWHNKKDYEMKITKKTLKRIIAEELQAMVNEKWGWSTTAEDETPEEYFEKERLDRAAKTDAEAGLDPETRARLESEWEDTPEATGWKACLGSEEERESLGITREACIEFQDEKENYVRTAMNLEPFEHRPVSEGKKRK
jgi:hypothetical protein